MKSFLTPGIVGFALGIITAAAGLTTIPGPVFVGFIVVSLVLGFVSRKSSDLVLQICVVVAAWTTGSFIALNFLLPHTMR